MDALNEGGSVEDMRVADCTGNSDLERDGGVEGAEQRRNSVIVEMRYAVCDISKLMASKRSRTYGRWIP